MIDQSISLCGLLKSPHLRQHLKSKPLQGSHPHNASRQAAHTLEVWASPTALPSKQKDALRKVFARKSGNLAKFSLCKPKWTDQLKFLSLSHRKYRTCQENSNRQRLSLVTVCVVEKKTIPAGVLQRRNYQLISLFVLFLFIHLRTIPSHCVNRSKQMCYIKVVLKFHSMSRFH